MGICFFLPAAVNHLFSFPHHFSLVLPFSFIHLPSSLPPCCRTFNRRRTWVSFHASKGDADHMVNLFWLSSPNLLFWIFQIAVIENSMSLTLQFYALVSDMTVG